MDLDVSIVNVSVATIRGALPLLSCSATEHAGPRVRRSRRHQPGRPSVLAFTLTRPVSLSEKEIRMCSKTLSESGAGRIFDAAPAAAKGRGEDD